MNIHTPLDSLIERRVRAVLVKEYGKDAAATERGEARVQYRVLEILAKVERIGRTEILRRAREAVTNPWYINYDEEFETVEEMLVSALGETTSQSVISDISFLVNEAIPFMRDHQIDGAMHLIGVNAAASSKARALVPKLRQTLRAGLPTDEAVEVFKEAVQKLSDKKVSEADIRKDNNTGKAIPEFTVYEYIHPIGSTLLIRVNSKQRAWIENRLGPKVKWRHANKGTRTSRVIDTLQGQFTIVDDILVDLGEFIENLTATGELPAPKVLLAALGQARNRLRSVSQRLKELAKVIVPEPKEL